MDNVLLLRNVDHVDCVGVLVQNVSSSRIARSVHRDRELARCHIDSNLYVHSKANYLLSFEQGQKVHKQNASSRLVAVDRVV